MPVHYNIHMGRTPSGRPQYPVLLHSDLYILTKAYNLLSFTSMHPICLNGMVLTCRWWSRIQNWQFGHCLMWQNYCWTIESWEWSQFSSHSDWITHNHAVTFHSPLSQVTFYTVSIKCHLHNTVCIKMSMCYKHIACYWWPSCSAMPCKQT